MSEFKAQAHMRELKQRLQLAIAGAVLTDSLDAQGLPALKIEKGGETIHVKISTEGNAGRVDGLGLAQRSYSPHKAQLLQDDTAADKDARAKTLAACAKLGMKLEIYEIASVPASFDLTGATLVSAIASDEIHPLTMSQ